MICPNCNFLCESHDKFCKKCGNMLPNNNNSPTDFSPNDFSPNEDETVGYFGNQNNDQSSFSSDYPNQAYNPQDNPTYYNPSNPQDNPAYYNPSNPQGNPAYYNPSNPQGNPAYYNPSNPQGNPAYYPNGNPQGFYQPIPVAEPPKKSKAPIIIGACLGGFIFFVGIILAIIGLASSGGRQNELPALSATAPETTGTVTSQNSKLTDYILKQTVYGSPINISSNTIDFINSEPIFDDSQLNVQYNYTDWNTFELLYYYNYNEPSLVKISSAYVTSHASSGDCNTFKFIQLDKYSEFPEDDATYFIGYSNSNLTDFPIENQFYDFVIVPIAIQADSLGRDTIICAIGDSVTNQYDPINDVQYAKVTTKNNNLLIRSSMEIIGSRIKDVPNNIIGSAEKDSSVEVLYTSYDDQGNLWAYIRCYYNVLTGGPNPKGATVEGFARVYLDDYALLTFE